MEIKIILTTIPKYLQEKLGIEGTEEVLNFIEKVQEKAKEEMRKEYLGEDEKRELRLEKKMEEVKGTLEKRIEETKFEILKWLIVMWVTLIIAMGVFKFL